MAGASFGGMGADEFRKSHEIDGSPGGAQTDYQVKIRAFFEYSFPDGRFYDMSSRSTTVTGNPTNMHGFSVVHDSKIVEVNKVIDGSSRKYLAYCALPLGDADEINLFYCDDLDGPWTPYSGNPILSGAGNRYSAPSAAIVGGTIHLFIDNAVDRAIERWTSADGINFAEQEDVIAGLTDLSHTSFIWFNPNDSKWYLYWRRGPGDPGGAAILARDKADITDLAGEADDTVTTAMAAFPTLMFRDGKYWLVTEWVGPGGAWQVRVRSSDSPIAGFTETDDSPILILDEACPRIFLSPDGSKCYLYTNRDAANWYQDTREIYATSFRDNDVDLARKCETDFGDVRFTESDGLTELDYYIEGKVDSDYADFWVEIPTIPADPDSVTIYIYYGKVGASTTSNGPNTFPDLFDDFDRANNNTVGNGWAETENAAGDISIETKRLKEVGTAAATLQCIKSYSSPQALYVVRGKWELAQSNVDKLIATLMYNGVDRAGFNARNDARIDYLNVSDWQDGTDYAAAIEYIFEIIIDEVNHEATYYFDELLVSADEAYYSSTEDPNQVDFRTVIAMLGTHYLHFIFIRKYVDPEPAHGDWGSEEAVVWPF